MKKMTKLAVLCSVLASASLVSGEASAGTLYRAPLSSNYLGINYWFDRNTGAGFLRYDGKTQANGVGYDTHTGIDFNMPSGGVWAGAHGTVVQVVSHCYDKGHPSYDESCGDYYGNNVKLQHADGKYTAYAHMKAGSVRVAMNDYVLCSRLLGDVGASGKVTSAHLHFETRNGLGRGSLVAYDPFGGDAGWGYGWRSSVYSSWVNQNGGLPTTQCQ